MILVRFENMIFLGPTCAQVYGLNFACREDGENFAKAMAMAIETMNNFANRPTPPPPYTHHPNQGPTTPNYNHHPNPNQSYSQQQQPQTHMNQQQGQYGYGQITGECMERFPLPEALSVRPSARPEKCVTANFFPFFPIRDDVVTLF